MLKVQRQQSAPTKRLSISHTFFTSARNSKQATLCTSSAWNKLNSGVELRNKSNPKSTKCLVCSKHRIQHAEPLIPSPFSSLPWEVGTDLIEWKKTNYLVVIDYSIEIAKLSSTTASDVIRHLKSIFTRHGIPDDVVGIG